MITGAIKINALFWITLHESRWRTKILFKRQGHEVFLAAMKRARHLANTQTHTKREIYKMKNLNKLLQKKKRKKEKFKYYTYK